ncbi:MAG TPA: glutaredoxin domain-containing protein [Kofleriaceae bacterium]|nr:glutaredoxin domain-containing protein [Kofleriaceae bacterium]
MPAHVKIYTREWCGYCTAALRFLEQKGVKFEHIDASGNPELRRWLVEATGRTTVPQIFIDGKAIGGYTDIRDLDDRGVLDRMLAGDEAKNENRKTG